MINVRNYNPETDYSSVESLYKDSSTYGGQFDEARDSEIRLKSLSEQKPDAIFVAEENLKIVGTVTLFGDSRAMWLYRFAVLNQETAEALWIRAKEICKELGHDQILVYAPTGNNDFRDRYEKLGFTKGGDYTAYWQDLK